MKLFSVNKTEIAGLYEIAPKFLSDKRGSFVKTFQHNEYKKNGINFHPKEEFFSISYKGVLRGMHFQKPPADHSKLVYCLSGEILDVVVDLRKGSSYGRMHSTRLDAVSRTMLFIPRGCAHGFLTLSDSSTVCYVTDNEYVPALDSGIHWNSIGYLWPEQPLLISERDSSHGPLSDFISPF